MTTVLHAIRVKYLGPTNSKGSRVKLISDRFGDSKTLEYNYAYNNALDQAVDYLYYEMGYEIVGVAELDKEYLVLTNTFKRLKGD